ncbi:FCP1like phosphatase, phosphatase subfamily protein [Acanthamoeba castellanii str. Neff]|uniref:RNA polymerase II subunit A C-terminal domain phosphatase n=1 Tax=Acanthamoeba castellanii (strain ATCC 30010 / Neff) TaxID=1257118 RepID=L8HI37_ACACF|nr:FCP1like phosphatase, phosphatase subfamily protein [Acanthamoeba castellanii str. Neff]ELR25244.1 FCP1like phosphatase, phosphatase subfamily protein [Acanthamoeba castellanii str. Neff]
MSKKKRSHEEDPVKRFDVVLPAAASAQVVRWSVKEGGDVLEGQELCAFLAEGSRDLQFLRSPFPFEGVIRQLHPEKALVSPGTTVAVVEYCAHEMVFADLCAICGKTINSSDKQATISLIPSQPALTVSRAVAERDAERTAERLTAAKKLSLVLDLDQTLVHATQDAEVETLFGTDAAEAKGGSITCALPNPPAGPEDVPAAHLYRFTLEGNPHKFYLKLRPHLEEFLMGVKDLFELHIYTMGSRSYARKVAQIIDPEQKLFRENIVSRDECGNVMNLKNLQRIFPVDDSMVMIIDDRVDVWGTSKNLIKIEPYYFFNDAKVNALPRDKEAPHPHRHPVRQALRRSSTGQASDVSSASASSSSSSSSSSSTAPNTKRKHEASDDDASSSPLPPASTPDNDDSTDAALPTDGGRQLLTSAAPAESAAAGEGEQKAQPPPKRRKIDISGMPRFKKKPAAAAAPDSSGAMDATDASPADATTQTETAAPAAVPAPAENERESESEKGKGKEQATTPPAAAAAEKSEAEQTDATTAATPHLPYRDVSLRDGHLLHVLRTLREAHRLFYAPEPAADAEPTPTAAAADAPGQLLPPAIPWAGRPRDIKYCLHVQRRRVLEGVHICFSSIFPTGSKPESTPLWRLSEEFGACCSNVFTPETTHLVALNERTEKVKLAHERGGVHIVHLEWLLESIRTWRRPEEARYRNLPGKPGMKEGLEPYKEHIRMLDMCYVRDLDKVLLAFHGPKAEAEEEEEVSDADQDEFLKWALKEGEGEEDEEDDEDEENEDEDEAMDEEDDGEKGGTTTRSNKMIEKAAKGEKKKEEGEGEGEEGEWDELERQLAEQEQEEGGDDEDRFDRLAALERLEEEEEDDGGNMGRGGKKRAKFGGLFANKKKTKPGKGGHYEDDDMEGLANEIEDELWGDDDDDDEDDHDGDE